MTQASNRAGLAIAFVLFGVLCISLNDMLIKQLSSGYPLHQIVFFRSFIALLVSFVFLQFEGGWRALRTDQPVLHVARGVLVVIANMAYFLALAVLPLADATALFFVAPLFITLLSIPLLGEKVGPLRMGAVFVGFIGVVIMQRPWDSSDSLVASRGSGHLPRRCRSIFRVLSSLCLWGSIWWRAMAGLPRRPPTNHCGSCCVPGSGPHPRIGRCWSAWG